MMADQKQTVSVVTGKTYSLFGEDVSTERYYATIRSILTSLGDRCPDRQTLLFHIQKAGGKRVRKKSGPVLERDLITHIQTTVHKALTVYTKGVREHLRTLPITRRFDATLRTSEKQYHYYMLEIELINQMYKEAFRQSSYKFALLPHCLRDFRPTCKAVPGDIEQVCAGCTEDCFIRLGSHLLRKYDIHPFISITIDLEKLFKKLKATHPGTGALGIACVPELVQGMRLCITLGIPPVGIPLNANRCARWMQQAHESSFDLKELEDLLRH